LSDSGSGWSSDVAAGIVWAADQGADVINLSLGGPGASSVIEQAVDYAVAAGSVVVASAGNNGTATPNYPAAYPSAIAVAASTQLSFRWTGSNSGPWLDITAPGVDIPSTYPVSAYAYLTGTSMAAPHVAGVAALVLQHRPTATVSQVRTALEGTATDMGTAGRDDLTGYGLVDADAAVAAIGGCGAAPDHHHRAGNHHRARNHDHRPRHHDGADHHRAGNHDHRAPPPPPCRQRPPPRHRQPRRPPSP
jgi:subtilisin family serine protease